MSKSKIFSAKILDAGNGMDAAFIIIPFDVKAAFGSMRPKVLAVFDRKVDYRGSLVRMGSPDHMLLMRKDVRAELKKGVGDEVHVKLSIDDVPRKVEVPEALMKVMLKNKRMSNFFEQLSYTNQKEYVQYLTEVKREETRKRRLLNAIELLKQGIKTPK